MADKVKVLEPESKQGDDFKVRATMCKAEVEAVFKKYGMGFKVTMNYTKGGIYPTVDIISGESNEEVAPK